MKLLLIGLMTLSMSIPSNAQEPIIFSEVVPVEGVSKEELYNRAKIWFTTSYNSANDVLQMDDKENGQIIGKAVITYNSSLYNASEHFDGSINYTIKVLIKDGRYKYEISNFIHRAYGRGSFGLITTQDPSPLIKGFTKKYCNKVWLEIKNQINEEVGSLIKSLKTGTSQQSDIKNDDW